MCIGKEENFQIIGSSHTDFTLCIKESLHVGYRMFFHDRARVRNHEKKHSIT